MTPLDAWVTPVATAAKAITRPTKAPPQDLRNAIAYMRHAAHHALDSVIVETGLAATPAQVLVTDRNGVADCIGQICSHLLGKLDIPARAPRRPEALALATLFAPLLSIMQCHTMGVYDSWTGERLVLCAPNILRLEAELGDQRGFVTDLVCLHEQTHRLQHVAAPWLEDYLLQLAQQVVHRCDEDCQDRAHCSDHGTQSRQAITAAMSVVEGHAVAVQTQVMRGRYADYDATRKAMQTSAPAARKWTSNALFCALPPLRKKLSQYKIGEKFCRTVLDIAGSDTMNRVWEGPKALPTLQELHNPQQWLARI